MAELTVAMALELDNGAHILEAWAGLAFYRLSAYPVPRVDRNAYKVSRVGANTGWQDRQKASLASRLTEETMAQMPE